jgi:hypothetical protein
MDRTSSSDLHRSLNLAGFRALATAAGLLQLCHELGEAGVLAPAAIGRIQQRMFDELMEQAPRSVSTDEQFAKRLRQRLENLFAGEERLSDGGATALT